MEFVYTPLLAKQKINHFKVNAKYSTYAHDISWGPPRISTQSTTFVAVMEVVTRGVKEGLPWELLYADDLVLVAQSKE